MVQLRLGSLLLLLCLLGLAALFPVAGFGLFAENREFLHAALGIAGGLVFAAGTYLVLAQLVKCPLCQGKLLYSQACARHTRTRKAMGSYRLRVAFGVLFVGRFRCPYCGEVCGCKVRERRHERSSAADSPRIPVRESCTHR